MPSVKSGLELAELSHTADADILTKERIFACLFLIPAPVAFFNPSRRRKLLDSQTGIASTSEEKGW
jgi:hypothetical protein